MERQGYADRWSSLGDIAVDRAVHHALGQGGGATDVRSGDPCVAVDGERTGIGGITAAADVCAAPRSCLSRMRSYSRILSNGTAA